MNNDWKRPAFNKDEYWINESWAEENAEDGCPVLVHFWSLSCSHCEKAMPALNRLLSRYKTKIHVLSVHMPRSSKDQDMNKVKQKAADLNIIHPLVVDNDNRISDEFQNDYVPSYYLFHPNKTLFHTQSGDSGMKLLRKKIDRLLGQVE